MLGELDISIAQGGWPSDCEDRIEACVKAALVHCQTDIGERAFELSILLSNDEQVQALNREYRGKDKPTNVLSFPALECAAPGHLLLEPGPLHLGDIVLAYGVVAREAQAQGISFDDHLSHLIIHGVLHLIGFDHMENDEAEEMETLEITILKEFGIANPYDSEAQ